MIFSISFAGNNTPTNQREFKGSSLLTFVRDFTAIDIETTGLSPLFDDIIELAAVKYRDGVEVDSFQQLVNPGREIDDFIISLTGITNEMLSDASGIEDVLPDYIRFLGDDILVGHNVSFDVNFIYDNCENIGLPHFSNDFIDTMRIARRMYKSWPNHKLDTMISKLGLRGRDTHRGANDAAIAAEGYIFMSSQADFSEAVKDSSKVKTKAKDIVARDGYRDEDNPLFDKVCVFTGALESYTRGEAMQLVADIGGICGDNVTRKTNFLIMGNNDYCSTIKGGKSNKQKKAEKLILEGADLQIIPESVFLDMIESD